MQAASETGFRPFYAAACGFRPILIIANPTSSNYSARRLASLASRLRQVGFSVNILEARAPCEIIEAARTAQCQAVLVAGGDGSVNAAIEGLLQRRPPRPVIGVIPMGLGNLLAAELRLPFSALALADLFNQGRSKPLFLGLANGRPFFLTASAGFDAKVVEAVAVSRHKQIFGRLAYAYYGLAAFVRGKNESLEVETDSRVISCKIAIVTNSKYYGAIFEVAPELSVFAPGFELIAVTRLSIATLVAFLFLAFFGKLRKTSFIEIVRVHHVEIRSANKVATEVDGDYHGTTPMVVCQCSETIDVLCP